MTHDGHERTPPYHRLVRLARPFPDFDFFFMRSLRQRAVRLLTLKPGDRVLDMGCGLGGSFPHLVQAVGPSGEVVGVEISPDVTINARRRIAKHLWRNVQVIEADARTVALTGTFDGLLMFGAPDVYASPEALDNCFSHLGDNARVVLFGAKTVNSRAGGALSLLFRFAFAKLTFSSTPRLDDAPWQMVAARVSQFDVEALSFGWMFLASGTVPSRGSQSGLAPAASGSSEGGGARGV
ncbi:MAG: SAM-dependent methyltransferase [Gemmatimonadaceae bacterium]